MVTLGYEGDPEFTSESLRARSFASAHHRNYFGTAHRVAPSPLEEEPRYDTAADQSNTHEYPESRVAAQCDSQL
jgi:hypothetical protein